MRKLDDRRLNCKFLLFALSGLGLLGLDGLDGLGVVILSVPRKTVPFRVYDEVVTLNRI